MSKPNANQAGLQTKNVIRVLGVTGLLLMIPFLAMQFDWQVTDPGSSTKEGVDWNLFDFVVMGTLMITTGLTYEVLAMRAETTAKRVALALVVLSVFFLIWVELAVGIFGTPFAGS